MSMFWWVRGWRWYWYVAVLVALGQLSHWLLPRNGVSFRGHYGVTAGWVNDVLFLPWLVLAAVVATVWVNRRRERQFDVQYRDDE